MLKKQSTKYGYYKSHTHQVNWSITHNQSNSCQLWWLKHWIWSQKECRKCTECPQRPLQSGNLLDCGGLYCGIIYLAGTTKTETLTPSYQDTSKINDKNMNSFIMDHLKIVHTWLLPRNMEKQPKIPSTKTLPMSYQLTRKNVSNRAAYFTIPELLSSHSLWHSAPLLPNNLKPQNSLWIPLNNLLITAQCIQMQKSDIKIFIDT